MASTLMARAGSARLPSFRPEPPPEEPPEEDDSPVEGVELGPLLGRGSYGRVYLGRWNGQEVAIKVRDGSGILADLASLIDLLPRQNPAPWSSLWAGALRGYADSLRHGHRE